MKLSIVLVEDDKKIANIVKAYLKNADFEVSHFTSGKDALEFIIENSPALILLDLMLPDTTGEELCQEIRDFTDVPIIMITAKVSEEERLAGFSLGADDYITKPFSPRELVLRVKAVLKRTQKDVDKSLSFENGRLILNPNTYEVILDNKNADFTPTEFKILYTLAHNPNKVYPRSDIVETALGYTYDGYDRSIDTHIKNIRNKLSKIDETQTFIITVYGIGYKFSGVKDN